MKMKKKNDYHFALILFPKNHMCYGTWHFPVFKSLFMKMWSWCIRNLPQVVYQFNILCSRFQLILKIELNSLFPHRICFFISYGIRFAVLGSENAFNAWVLVAFFPPLSLYNHIICVCSVSSYKKTQVKVNLFSVAVLVFHLLHKERVVSSKDHFRLVAGMCYHVFL